MWTIIRTLCPVILFFIIAGQSVEDVYNNTISRTNVLSSRSQLGINKVPMTPIQQDIDPNYILNRRTPGSCVLKVIIKERRHDGNAKTIRKFLSPKTYK